jgi:TonB family protein
MLRSKRTNRKAQHRVTFDLRPTGWKWIATLLAGVQISALVPGIVAAEQSPPESPSPAELRSPQPSQSPPPEPSALSEPKTDTPAYTDAAIELFTSPKPKHIDVPEFPPEQLFQNNEGWVELSLMVDPSGKPFDVTVVRSTGNRKFEDIATHAIERSTFEPGMLNGVPVEAGFEMKYKFTNARLDREPGARPEFIRAYKALEAAVKSGEQAAADTAMKNLEVTNLYEDAFCGLAQYIYAGRWGDPSQQLRGLQRAIAEEDRAHYLPPEMFRVALLDSFRLQVNLHDYAGAMTTWKRLQRSRIDKDTSAKLNAVVGQLEKIRNDDSAYPVRGAITDGNWYLHLFKRHFRAKVSDGSLTEVKLRCDKRHYFFAFDPALEYQVNSVAGNCSIELLGTPGTHFDLIQF